jgi:signal transduction histidine kinase
MGRGRAIDRLTIRAVTFLALAVTVALWMYAGYQLTRRISDVQRQAAALDSRYMQAQELLSTVRAQILIASVYVRDALLDPRQETLAAYRRQTEGAFDRIDMALRQYVPVVDSVAERNQITRLKREIDDFRYTLADVLTSDNRRWAADARLLSRQIVSKREAAIRLSEEAQTLNRASFVQQQAGNAEIYRHAQRQVWRQLGLALAASLGIALLATVYAGRLESQLRAQRAKEAHHSADLQRLSSRLISAQEDERRTIARELHDEVGQALTAIKVELSLASKAVVAAGAPAHVLDDARAIADGALTTVRDLSQLLHPAMLDDLGLPAAIDWYVRGYSKRYDIRVDLLQEGITTRFAREIEVAAFRIVQEALTNAAKHGDSKSCRVRLTGLPDALTVSIEDDGKGFEFDHNAGRRGLGLLSIRERVAQLRGVARIESSLGGGTRVYVEFPTKPRMNEVNGTSAALGVAHAGHEVSSG